MSQSLFVLCFLGMGVGALQLISILTGRSGASAKPIINYSRKMLTPSRKGALVGLVIGILLTLVTGLPIMALIGFEGGWLAVMIGVKPVRDDVIKKLEDIASWTESLRDGLSANAGLLEAIESTSRTCPDGIRVPVIELSNKINAGLPIKDALREFANKLDDPVADMAIAPLVVAATASAGDIGPILTTASEQLRNRIRIWQRIGILQARPRRQMRTIIGVSLGFVVVMLLTNKSFMQPLTTAAGQLADAAVCGVFALAFILGDRLTRPKPQPRLFGTLEGENAERAQKEPVMLTDEDIAVEGVISWQA